MWPGQTTCLPCSPGCRPGPRPCPQGPSRVFRLSEPLTSRTDVHIQEGPGACPPASTRHFVHPASCPGASLRLLSSFVGPPHTYASSQDIPALPLPSAYYMDWGCEEWGWTLDRCASSETPQLAGLASATLFLHPDSSLPQQPQPLHTLP